MLRFYWIFQIWPKYFHRLVVKVAGTPKPSVRWFVNNKEVTKITEIIIEEIEENVFTLTIKKVKPKFLGPITCEAYNELGVVRTTTLLRQPSKFCKHIRIVFQYIYISHYNQDVILFYSQQNYGYVFSLCVSFLFLHISHSCLPLGFNCIL